MIFSKIRGIWLEGQPEIPSHNMQYISLRKPLSLAKNGHTLWCKSVHFEGIRNISSIMTPYGAQFSLQNPIFGNGPNLILMKLAI